MLVLRTADLRYDPFDFRVELGRPRRRIFPAVKGLQPEDQVYEAVFDIEPDAAARTEMQAVSELLAEETSNEATRTSPFAVKA